MFCERRKVVEDKGGSQGSDYRAVTQRKVNTEGKHKVPRSASDLQLFNIPHLFLSDILSLSFKSPTGSIINQAHLENVGQFSKSGALGEQQRWRALAGHMVQVQLEPDGAHLRDGWANVLQGKTHTHTKIIHQTFQKIIETNVSSCVKRNLREKQENFIKFHFRELQQHEK